MTAIGALATVLFGVVTLVVANLPGAGSGSMPAAPTSSGARPTVATGPTAQASRPIVGGDPVRVAVTDYGIDLDTGDIVPRLGPGEIRIRIDNQPHPTELVDAEANDTGLAGLNGAVFAPWTSGSITRAGCLGLRGSEYKPSVPLSSSIGLPSSVWSPTPTGAAGWKQMRVETDIDGRPVAYRFTFALW